MVTIRNLWLYYESLAPNYSAIEPAFAPLATSLVHFADLQSNERVIDLGTGTGLAATLAARHASTIGLDFSHRMLRSVRNLTGSQLVQGDMHRLPFPQRSFDAILAAFALNSTDPQLSFAEAHRTLKSGGRLLIYEWGTVDPLSEFLQQTIDMYAVEDPSPELQAFRSNLALPLPWDSLKELSGLVFALEGAGFEVQVSEIIEVPVRLSSPAEFLAYKMAWPARQMELGALDRETQTLLMSDLLENLETYRHPDGSLLWEPDIVRIRAFRA